MVQMVQIILIFLFFVAAATPSAGGTIRALEHLGSAHSFVAVIASV
jgi:hypothetical protein